MKQKHPFRTEALKALVYWITERELIRHHKEAGHARPWTKDPILAKYRFCNVDRNDDAVTQWIHSHWLHPFGGDSNLWFAMVVARLLNLPECLLEAQKAVFSGGGSVRWLPSVFVATLSYRRATGAKLFNAAYIVSTNGHAMDKVEYLAARVLTPLWEARRQVSPNSCDTLETFHKTLTMYDGLGSFMAAQVVADIKYDPRSPLNNAPDFRTWAASGPGSRRGMNRLFERPADAPYREQQWRADMAILCDVLWSDPKLAPYHEKLTAQNVQNCLCEFDKYMRAKRGEGEPKQLYRSKV